MRLCARRVCVLCSCKVFSAALPVNCTHTYMTHLFNRAPDVTLWYGDLQNEVIHINKRNNNFYCRCKCTGIISELYKIMCSFYMRFISCNYYAKIFCDFAN